MLSFRYTKQTSKSVADTTFKIFLGSASKAMVDREKKEGNTKIQTFEYLENENSFFNEIKNIVFKGLSFGEKLKI